MLEALALFAQLSVQSEPVMTAQSWSCDRRLTCGKIDTCEEARWYLDNCRWGGKLDRDSDGSPCESPCGQGG